MKVWHTYFLMANELWPGNQPDAPQTSPIVDSRGNVIAMTSHKFAENLFIEGSGKLRDGRVVNVSGNHCGQEHFDVASFSGEPCYHVLSPQYPWGGAANGRPLEPLRTIATDASVIPRGAWVYIRQFDGLQIPRVGSLGGFRHDGWFRADDSGGGIRGPHIDIFAGDEGMYAALDHIFPTAWRNSSNSGVGPGFDLTIGGGPSNSSFLKWLGIAAAIGGGSYLIYEGVKRTRR